MNLFELFGYQGTAGQHLYYLVAKQKKKKSVGQPSRVVESKLRFMAVEVEGVVASRSHLARL